MSLAVLSEILLSSAVAQPFTNRKLIPLCENISSTGEANFLYGLRSVSSSRAGRYQYSLNVVVVNNAQTDNHVVVMMARGIVPRTPPQQSSQSQRVVSLSLQGGQTSTFAFEGTFTGVPKNATFTVVLFSTADASLSTASTTSSVKFNLASVISQDDA